MRMPWLPTYQGSRGRQRTIVGVLLIWSLALGLLVGCQNDYPVEPTFCDDWCLALEGTACSDEPAVCVRRCEEGLATGDCALAQRDLLGCYQHSDKAIFTCSDGEQRVRDGFCQNERDALYECSQPGIGECLSSCRVLQTTLSEGPTDASTDRPDVACQVRGQSCEKICWALVSAARAGNSIDVDRANWPDAGDLPKDLPDNQWTTVLVGVCLNVSPQ